MVLAPRGLGGVVSFGTPAVAAAPVVPYVAPYPAMVVPRPYVVGPVWGSAGATVHALWVHAIWLRDIIEAVTAGDGEDNGPRLNLP